VDDATDPDMKTGKITFLFYHYGKIPRYLEYAIEQVRVFNPKAEIFVITDGIRDTSRIDRFNVSQLEMNQFHSEELAEFKRIYQHISCFKEKYERFVLERWFVTEIIRKQRPERIYIMQDSDVALFGDAELLLSLLPEKPICLSNMNPHFTFIKGDISGFLNFILEFYRNEEKLTAAKERFRLQNNPDHNIFNQGEMQFLFDYIKRSEDMAQYDTKTPHGFIDCNIHGGEGFDCMQLRRRPRKKVFWKLEEGSPVPHFKKGDALTKAFLLHFQGPGKRVFFRFSGSPLFRTRVGIWLLNQLFQKPLIANLS
jgi:hypothetical protein